MAGNVLASLARLAENDDAVGTTSRVTFNAVAGTTYQIAVSGYRNGTGGVAGGNIRLSVTQGMVDYSDLWWLGPAEDGWGMTEQQHGLVQFNVLYVCDNAGRPAWYVMPGGSWSGTPALASSPQPPAPPGWAPPTTLRSSRPPSSAP